MPTAFEWVSFSLGLCGTAIGIFLGIRQLVNDRVRLKIKCYPLLVGNKIEDAEPVVCVEVINAGSFPVTIKEVFIELAGNGGLMTNSDKKCSDGSTLPKRVDARDAVYIYFSGHGSTSSNLNQASRLIVETACGESRFNNLKDWRRQQTAKERDEKLRKGENPEHII